MKAYIFYFLLPSGKKVYCAVGKRKVSEDPSDAQLWPLEEGQDIDDLKDKIQDEFNELWDEDPDYRNKEIWNGVSLDDMNLFYEQVSDRE